MAARKKKTVDETTVTEPVESGGETGEATAAESVESVAEAETGEATVPADVPAEEPAAEAKPVKATAKKAVQTVTASAQALAFPFNRTLKYGADGEDVKALQAALLAAGGDVAETGVYDLRTVHAVQRLQRQRGLPASGIIGKHDYAALLGTA